MKRKFGFGTLSIILFVFAIIWSVNIKLLNVFCLGDVVLEMLSLPAWSRSPNGTTGLHYTIFYSLGILILSIIVGHKFPEHIFAKLGQILSIVFGLIFICAWFISTQTTYSFIVV